MQFPSDYTQHIPIFVYDWLMKYSIEKREVQKYRFGYSEKKEALIMPVFIDSELIMFQTRYFGENEKEPKYRTYGYKQDIIYVPDPHPTKVVAIVEDYLSAIKVCRVTNCMPIFGSAMSQEQIYRLSKLYKKARLWLDPNMKEKAVKTALMMSGMGLPTTTIFSDKDPKEYKTADIRHIVDPLGD